ncbi:MAG: hypothetical protein U5S82_18210 [Gammaproteobacteria bacterium]|nr:hypothetical protein [Gammaproteobacteria bacterium]
MNSELRIDARARHGNMSWKRSILRQGAKTIQVRDRILGELGALARSFFFLNKTVSVANTGFHNSKFKIQNSKFKIGALRQVTSGD